MRCPVCRAENDEGPQCRRCRTDLSLLFALEEQRNHALGVAYQFLRLGKFRHALAIAAGVEALRTDEDSRRLRAVVYLLERDYAGAWDCYQNSSPTAAR
jgi:hypothetical protein